MTGRKVSSPVPDALLADLRARLAKAVVRNPAGVLFFSGGLDTSILALLSPSTPALHICLDDGGPDFPFAQTVARSLGLDLIVRRVSVEEALAAIPEVIRIRRSFDPALPNDLALYFAFAEADRLGHRSVMTGDGADELFAGYSYMFDLDLERYISWLVGRMSFSANGLGAAFGIRVCQPFLDREVMTLALAIPPDLKVREQNGQRYGKWVLRRAFEGLLPPGICWQGKRPVDETPRLLEWWQGQRAGRTSGPSARPSDRISPELCRRRWHPYPFPWSSRGSHRPAGAGYGHPPDSGLCYRTLSGESQVLPPKTPRTPRNRNNPRAD